MSRPVKGEARSAILEVAERLFYQEGIRAVGVDRIAAEAGITKRTLYYHFPSKEALVQAYLARFDQTNRPVLLAQAERFGSLPGDRLLGIFAAFIGPFDTSDYRGCAFLNAMVESEADTNAIRGGVTEHKNAVRDWMRDQLTEAGMRNPSMLAEQLMLLLDGALIRVLIYPGSAVIRQAKEAAASLLNASGVALSPENRPVLA